MFIDKGMYYRDTGFEVVSHVRGALYGRTCCRWGQPVADNLGFEFNWRHSPLCGTPLLVVGRDAFNLQYMQQGTVSCSAVSSQLDTRCGYTLTATSASQIAYLYQVNTLKLYLIYGFFKNSSYEWKIEFVI
jgi:hypothetical protein